MTVLSYMATQYMYTMINVRHTDGKKDQTKWNWLQRANRSIMIFFWILVNYCRQKGNADNNDYN